MMRWLRALVFVTGCIALSLGAASTSNAQVGAGSVLLSAFVLQGANGTMTVRAIVESGNCPRVVTDIGSTVMSLRALGDLGGVGPSPRTGTGFPFKVCTATLPKAPGWATLEGRLLPLPKATVRRIVVVGDTGCRLKSSKSGGAYQSCKDASAYPFAAIAKSAARWKPDLVIHVGDYHYRESPCPEGKPGCAQSPYGYGWDAWNADFFHPAAPLLAVAPIVAARGNHEVCERAGVGFRLLLDQSFQSARTSCLDPDLDGVADFSPSYAVPLGSDWQLVVFDSSRAGNLPLKPTEVDFPSFVNMRREIGVLSRRARHTILVDHHPLLAYAAAKAQNGTVIYPGNAALISTFMVDGQELTPRGVDLILSGHVHAWEALRFSSGQPAQIVAGFSGTEEDTVPLPVAPPVGLPPAPGAVVSAFSSWVDGFGFMTMTRTNANHWRIEVRNVDGAVVNRCNLTGKNLACAVDQPPTPLKP